jgi:hypothetical protein
MELVESNDPKSLLLQQSAKHKKNLEDEIKMLSENTEKTITNALIIGGTLAVTYFIVRQLTKSKSKRKSKAKKTKSVQEDDSKIENSSAETQSDPSIMSQIGSAIAAQATVFLLDMAKDKLSAYLQAYFEKEAPTTNERS